MTGGAGVRFALVGVEHWHAAFYLESFRLAGAQIAAVSDPDESIAKRFAATAGCPAFADHRLLVERAKPDFLMVMARHADLPAVALELLPFGLPMGLEKPLGVAAGQITPLVEEVARRGAFVAVPLINRYSRLWEELAVLEARGRVGTRAHGHFRVINGIPQRYSQLGVGWMLDPAVSGGGGLRNLGVHAADAFLQFAQEDGAEVVGSAVTHRLHGIAVEDMAAALLVSPGGVIGTLEAGYSFATREAGGDFEWRVAAANCYLIDRGETLEVTTLDDGETRILPNLSPKERYRRFGADTLARLAEGRPPAASVEDCRRAVAVVDSVYARAVPAGRWDGAGSRGGGS